MIDANKTIAPHGKKHAFAMSLSHLGTSHCVSPGREGGGGHGFFFLSGFEGEKRGDQSSPTMREGRKEEGGS